MSIFLSPANEVCEGYVFTGLSTRGGGGVSTSGGGLHPGVGLADPPDTTGYGQRAGGTHPTGMHSCLVSTLWSHTELQLDLYREQYSVKSFDEY